MPSVAPSPEAPTATVTVFAPAKRVVPSTVAVTRTVFAPPSSATEDCTPCVAVSASTVSVTPEGASSSSVMVPVASRVVPSPLRVALLAEDSRNTTVSLPSSRLSPVTVTATVLLVSPAAKASVPAVSA